MKTFKIYETKPATYTWVYEVQAETEEEAIQMVQSGYVIGWDYGTDIDRWAIGEFEAEEIED